MKIDFVKTMKEAFQDLFPEKPPENQPNAVCSTMDVGNGWFKLIWALCDNIQQELEMHPKVKDGFMITSVKEHKGSLMFEVSTANMGIFDLIEKAESQSESICLQCGSDHGLIVEIVGEQKCVCIDCYGRVKNDIKKGTLWED